jgi:type VI secretion system protein
MFKIRLLERLARTEIDPDFSGYVSGKEEMDSIFNYLKNILSTKEGSTLIAYDFGIPDISNYHEQSYGEYIRTLENKLKNTIEKYEPRLKDIKIEYIDKYKDKSILTFRIEAKLANVDNYILTFETKIKSNGEININEEY